VVDASELLDGFTMNQNSAAYPARRELLADNKVVKAPD